MGSGGVFGRGVLYLPLDVVFEDMGIIGSETCNKAVIRVGDSNVSERQTHVDLDGLARLNDLTPGLVFHVIGDAGLWGRKGFPETVAPLYANLTLLLEIAMGVGLLIGALLARLRRFGGHARCQSVILLLNLAVIMLTMIPSFRAHVSPKIPLKLGKAYYALATAHAALGTITEIAGLYILLAAGTSVLPETFRITKYKLWMRTVLALWWVVLLLGLATYARWYVPHLFRK
jgi:uncharacterized membrane protein YozB (DUF420 family)